MAVAGLTRGAGAGHEDLRVRGDVSMVRASRRKHGRRAWLCRRLRSPPRR